MDFPSDHKFDSLETVRVMNQATLITQPKSKLDTAEDEPEKACEKGTTSTKAAHEKVFDFVKTENCVKQLKLLRSHFIMSGNTKEPQYPSQWSQADIKEFYEYFVIKRILIDQEFILDPYANYGEGDMFNDPVGPGRTVSAIIRRQMSSAVTQAFLHNLSSFLENLEEIDVGQLYDDDYTLSSVAFDPDFSDILDRTKLKLERQESSDELGHSFCRNFVFALDFLTSPTTFSDASEDDYKLVFYTYLDFICRQIRGIYAQILSKTYETRICKVTSPFDDFTIRTVPDIIIFEESKCKPNNIVAIVEVKKDLSELRLKRRKMSEETVTGQIAVKETDKPCDGNDDSHKGAGKQFNYMKLPKKKYYEQDEKKVARYEVSKSESDLNSDNLREMFKNVDLATCCHLNSTEKKYIQSFLPQLLAGVFTVFDDYHQKSGVSKADALNYTRQMRYAIGVIGLKVTFVTVVISCPNQQKDDKVITLNPQGFPVAKFRGKDMHTDVFVTKQLDLLKKDDRKKIGETLWAILINAT